MARSYTNPAPGPIGSTFSAAAGQANNKLYVAANGQTLNKADYPELAGAYNDQSQEFVGNVVDINTNGQLPRATFVSKLMYDSTSTYAIYAQQVVWNSTNGMCFWKTTNATEWSLLSFVLDGGNLEKVVAIGSDVYVCASTGLWKITGGTTVTKLRGGQVSDICTNGTTFLIVDNTSTAYSTTDFVTYTNISPGVNARGCVFFNTRYYVLSNTNTLQYSSDLSTWTSTPITIGASTTGSYCRVINGNLVLLFNTNGQPIYRYNTDPLVNAWSSSGRTYNSGNHTSITGMFYDATTTEYVLTVGYNTNGGAFAFVFSSLPSSGSQASTSTIPSTATDSVAVVFGSVRAWNVGSHYSYSSNVWQTGGINITTAGVFQNPFLQSNGIGYSRGGITPNGLRWLQKPVGDTGVGQVFQSIMVEIGGVWKGLDNGASIWGTNVNAAYNSAVLYDDANGYALIVFQASSNYYWATYNSSRQQVQAGVNSTPSATQSYFYAVKNVGIQIHEGQSASSRTVYRLSSASSSAPSSFFSYNLATTSDVRNIIYSEVTQEMIITELNSTPTSSPTFYIIQNGALAGQYSISLLNSSGSSVSVASNCRIFKLGGIFYCINNSVLFSSPNGILFNQVSNIPSSPPSSSCTPMLEFAPNVALGNYKIINYFGTVSYQDIGGSPTTSGGIQPNFFPMNGSISFGSYTQSSQTYGYRYSSSVDTTTQFLIPSIASTTAGQGVYIVAR